MVSPSSSERIRPRDHGRASFYTRFYTAGRDWLVRSGTDWHVECAKPQLRGTRRYGTGRQERLGIGLITRRSQVQILPPPPTKHQVRGLFGEIREGPSGVFWPPFYTSFYTAGWDEL